MNSLAHKVALVTGVTRRQGIGAAVALALAQAGADVCTAYYRPYDRRMPWNVEDTEPDTILDALRQTGVRAEGVEIDLAHPEGPHTLFTQARDRFGRIDILVNNAANQSSNVAHEPWCSKGPRCHTPSNEVGWSGFPAAND